MIKPGAWGLSPQKTDPKWRWFWEYFRMGTFYFYDGDRSIYSASGSNAYTYEIPPSNLRAWGTSKYGVYREFVGNSTFDSPDIWNRSGNLGSGADGSQPATYIALIRRTTATTDSAGGRVVNITEAGSSNTMCGISLNSTTPSSPRVFIRESDATTLFDFSMTATPLTAGEWCLVIASADPTDSTTGASWVGVWNLDTGEETIETFTRSAAPSTTAVGDRFELGGWYRNGYGLPADMSWAAILQTQISVEQARQLARDPFGPIRRLRSTLLTEEVNLLPAGVRRISGTVPMIKPPPTLGAHGREWDWLWNRAQFVYYPTPGYSLQPYSPTGILTHAETGTPSWLLTDKGITRDFSGGTSNDADEYTGSIGLSTSDGFTIIMYAKMAASVIQDRLLCMENTAGNSEVQFRFSNSTAGYLELLVYDSSLTLELFNSGSSFVYVGDWAIYAASFDGQGTDPKRKWLLSALTENFSGGSNWNYAEDLSDTGMLTFHEPYDRLAIANQPDLSAGVQASVAYAMVLRGGTEVNQLKQIVNNPFGPFARARQTIVPRPVPIASNNYADSLTDGIIAGDIPLYYDPFGQIVVTADADDA